MATIFENQKDAYNGITNDATLGTGDVLVHFECNKNGASTLTLMARAAGTTRQYIPIRTSNKSTLYKFSAAGIQYYFVWEPLGRANSGVVASLDA